MPNDISVQLAPAVRAGSDTATDCKVVSTSEPPAIFPRAIQQQHARRMPCVPP